MTGGYISIKDELLHAAAGTEIIGSFAYAKSLISAKKPIFGVVTLVDDNEIKSPCTYTGCVMQTSDTNIRIILQVVAFDTGEYTPNNYSVQINISSDDFVSK